MLTSVKKSSSIKDLKAATNERKSYMKKYVRSLSILLLVFSLLIGITAYAASGNTTVFYWKEYMGEGTTSDINYSLKSAGYTSTRVSKSYPDGVLLAFRNKKVVHVYTHGLDGGGGILCSDNKMLYTSDMSGDFSGCKLIFLEICQGAKNSPTYGRVDAKCKTLGAKSTIAFTENITAVTAFDGIHYFSKRVYYYLCSQAAPVSSAVSMAKFETYQRYGEYYGSDSCQTYGGSTKIR